MLLTTQRLRLRLLQDKDLDFFHTLHSFPEVDRYNTLGIPVDKAASKLLLDGLLEELQHEPVKHYPFVIEEGASENPIGIIALRMGSSKFRNGEIWYKISPDYWGKGNGTEALRAVLNFAFRDLDLHRITAGCAVDNQGSSRVLEKGGMQREGRTRASLPLKTGWSDGYNYAILQSDWRKLNHND